MRKVYYHVHISPRLAAVFITPPHLTLNSKILKEKDVLERSKRSAQSNKENSVPSMSVFNQRWEIWKHCDKETICNKFSCPLQQYECYIFIIMKEMSNSVRWFNGYQISWNYWISINTILSFTVRVVSISFICFNTTINSTLHFANSK